MTIKLLFFGATAGIVGKRRVELECEGRTAVEDVLARLSGDYPAFRLHRLLFAVNEEYVDGSHVLDDGDALAVFTAVSGG